MADSGFTRVELDGTVEHRGGQQFVNGKGYAGDGYESVHRIEPHGFASHPVKGGIGLLAGVRGNRDSAYLIGAEKPSLRPDLPQGASAQYDDKGNIIKLIGDDGAVFDFASRSATLTCGDWTIDAPSGVTINGPLTVNGPVSVGGAVAMTGDITVTGNMAMTGDIGLDGNMTATGSVVDGDGDGGA
ncbi:phage baseplate assembly protein domain-containing protein [Jiella marina]|uniref:phage baseplate assembly protein domain-containing protein n=1 Tax=Jiella sp. LLJ827 TaxID=2917712 RepID=UPI0021012825|nr:phage baseplate assembly protein [Jiella sp. LLJ827]MCQ0986395.1 phage baseplate assembly protein [Jiella sp. LLJ827]